MKEISKGDIFLASRGKLCCQLKWLISWIILR